MLNNATCCFNCTQLPDDFLVGSVVQDVMRESMEGKMGRFQGRMWPHSVISLPWLYCICTKLKLAALIQF